MSALLSNAAVLSSVGVMTLAAAIVVVAIWCAVLSVKVSKLNKMVLMEQERSVDLARQLSMQGRRRPNPQVGAGTPSAVSPAGMPVESPSAATTPVEEERSKKPRGRKGKPTIPFGANKEAQARAQQIYTANADDVDYEPDSIDFNKVEGLRSARTPAQPYQQPAPRPQMGAMPANGARQQRQRPVREARERLDSQSLDRRTTGKMAPVDPVGNELRSRNGASSAWVEEDARRVVERHERAARRQRLSERRQQEQLRRQAESIVAEHHRQMSEVNKPPTS